MTTLSNCHVVTNSAGSQFLVRIVRKGERYGKTLGLVHDRKDPLVEFYDTDYNHDRDESGVYLGQFVSRYSYGALNRPNRPDTGLNLSGGVKKWWLDRTAFRHAMTFARNYLETA